MNDVFRQFSKKISELTGNAWTFVFAVVIVLTWLVTGPIFQFSTTWQLFINSFTTIVTFLMVFLIQNTQNRDAKAIHLKLDELIHASRNAKDTFMNAEDFSDEELDSLEKKFVALSKARKQRIAKNP